MNQDLILQYIKILEKKEETFKKVAHKEKQIKKVKGEKVKDYRKQVEYGEKKFIKP